MKPTLWYSGLLLMSILLPSNLTLGVCPEAPNDNGVCDTLYVKVWPYDTLFADPGQLVRVPIYVTHDVPDPIIDSIAAFSLPLCYSHTNPAKYCSLSTYWNKTAFSGSALSRSIFRHILQGNDTLVHNWMMDLFQEGNVEEWNGIILNLNGTSHFWLSLITSGSEDRRFGPSGRTLIATMTLRVEDTMTVCIDSCFWPPNTRLSFTRSDAVSYIPRDNLPYCFSLSPFSRGNANGNGVIDLGDVVYLITYLYKNGPAPNPLLAGDANCSGLVELGDVVYLITYLYKGGPPPPC